MLLGWLHYDNSNDLPPLLLYLNYAENVIKNALAPVLPVFDDGGALLSQRWLLAYSPVIVSTALLCGLVLRRHLSHLQRIALALILVNAVAHFALFRFRLHYLSHAAFCLFVATSPLLGQRQEHSRKKLAVQTLALVVLAGGILSTSSALHRWLLERNGAFETLVIEGVERYGDVAQEVIDEYR